MKEDRTWVTVDLDAVEANFDAMKRNLKADVPMLAVLKADGYGHGAVPIGKLAEAREDVWGFACAAAQEALKLRGAGLKKPILILGHVFEGYLEPMIREDVRMAVYELETAKAISDAAQRIGKAAKIHLALDTGMTRIGMKDVPESVELVKKIRELPGIEIEGMFTHFARADETDKQYAHAQLRRYLDFCDLLEKAGIRIPIRHCSNSAGIIDLPEANLDMVRAGISIYGLYPSDEVEKERVPLRPAMQWKARVAYVKEVEAGVQVSYGGTFTTTGRTRIATIPVGYADGYPRSLSGKGYVLIDGKRAPILGRVCMDQFMADVTGIPEVKMDTEVTLVGEDHGEALPVETLSALSGRFPYEFVCCVGKRVPRYWLRDGKVVEKSENGLEA